MTLQDIKKTKCFTDTLSFVCSFGQRENSIPSRKHSLRGGIKSGFSHDAAHIQAHTGYQMGTFLIRSNQN